MISADSKYDRMKKGTTAFTKKKSKVWHYFKPNVQVVIQEIYLPMKVTEYRDVL
jgi:hypothetical protein